MQHIDMVKLYSCHRLLAYSNLTFSSPLLRTAVRPHPLHHVTPAHLLPAAVVIHPPYEHLLSPHCVSSVVFYHLCLCLVTAHLLCLPSCKDIGSSTVVTTLLPAVYFLIAVQWLIANVANVVSILISATKTGANTITKHLKMCRSPICGNVYFTIMILRLLKH